jgi:hypothetical protein
METVIDNELLGSVKLSINTIDKCDYEVAKSELINNQLNVYKDRFSTYENNFVTKFNEKYSIEVLKGTIEDYKGLVRQLQIPKIYIFSEQKDMQIERGYKNLIQYCGEEYDGITDLELIPDFFIHKNQADDKVENQKLIMEFKTERSLSERKFAWDFFKLNIYLEKYNFQNAIFVAINSSRDRINGYLIKYLTNKLYLSRHSNRLHILVKETYEAEIQDINVWQVACENGRKI